MSALVRKHKVLTAVAVLLAVMTLGEGWSYSAPLRGKLAARRDVAHGHYKLLAYGLPPIGRPEYSRLLRERYNIELQAVASCTVSEELRLYVDNYDEVSIFEANRKFGHDIFKECWDEAEKETSRKVQEGSKNN